MPDAVSFDILSYDSLLRFYTTAIWKGCSAVDQAEREKYDRQRAEALAELIRREERARGLA